MIDEFEGIELRPRGRVPDAVWKAQQTDTPKRLRRKKPRAEGTFYDQNRDRQLTLAKVNRAKRSKEYWMWYAAKYRAKKSGIEFSIEVEDIIVPEICPVFGVPIVQPSLDRVDNAKGYVRGNIYVISKRANEIKRDASLAEITMILRYMERHAGS